MNHSGCKREPVLLFLLILLLCMPARYGFSDDKSKTILVLHSYHKADWTDSLLEGIKSELNNIDDLDLVIEYMDTKRINTPGYYRALDDIYSMKYNSTSFDVILTSDDNAYRFVLARQDGVFEKVPLVFCGVNRFDPLEIQDIDFVTGIVEKGDFKDTLAFAAKARRNAKTVHIIIDSTPTSRINQRALLQALAEQSPHMKVELLSNISLSELSIKLSSLPDDDFAFFVSFWEDGLGQPVSPDDLSDAFKNSAVPVFGRSEWMMGKGLTGGKCVSGFNQGQAAAKLARRILSGESVSQIPVDKNSPNRFMFDYELLERYNIDHTLVPAHSLILNKPPPTLYQTNKGLIWSVIAVFLVLLSLVVSLALNINLRRKTETALRESKDHYQLLVNNQTDMIVKLDVEGRFLFVSPSFCRMFGKSSEELLGRYYLPFVHEEDLAQTTESMKDLFKPPFSVFIEHRARIKDGWKWLSWMETAVLDDENSVTAIIGVGRDITKQVQAEKKLQENQEKIVRLQKMESLGLLAGGVAHDLNNVLSGIVSYPELILLDLKEDDALIEPITTILESGHRAVAIVQDLLTVARGVATTRNAVTMNDLVNDYLRSPEFKKLQHNYPGISVQTGLAEDLLNVFVSPVHMRKVVMNLVVNAFEASDGSGTVEISTENRYLDKPLQGYDDVSTGEYCVLTISDTGPGISKEDLGRIFEPFYSKKVMGRSGTGLGLAVVWNIIQDHQGYIDIQTGRSGTRIDIYLPITRKEVAGEETPLSIAGYTGNGETILVVDDEETQRVISCRILEKLGYTCTSVASGELAVEYLERNSVDLVLLDMIMDPGIGGYETYKRIIAIHPGQKALIFSGFSESEDVKRAQSLGAGRYIKKPVTMERIGLAVKEELMKEAGD
jgi:PAS domain S-box-containing protein